MLTKAVSVQQRLVRASSIHGLAGMAAIMASTYKAYMGEGLGDFGKWLMKFKIPHFGKVRQSLLPPACMHDLDSTQARDLLKAASRFAAAMLVLNKTLAVSRYD